MYRHARMNAPYTKNCSQINKKKTTHVFTRDYACILCMHRCMHAYVRSLSHWIKPIVPSSISSFIVSAKPSGNVMLKGNPILLSSSAHSNHNIPSSLIHTLPGRVSHALRGCGHIRDLLHLLPELHVCPSLPCLDCLVQHILHIPNLVGMVYILARFLVFKISHAFEESRPFFFPVLPAFLQSLARMEICCKTKAACMSILLPIASWNDFYTCNFLHVFSGISLIHLFSAESPLTNSCFDAAAPHDKRSFLTRQEKLSHTTREASAYDKSSRRVTPWYKDTRKGQHTIEQRITPCLSSRGSSGME